jgi:hypothetical protein
MRKSTSDGSLLIREDIIAIWYYLDSLTLSQSWMNWSWDVTGGGLKLEGVESARII